MTETVAVHDLTVVVVMVMVAFHITLSKVLQSALSTTTSDLA